MARRAEETEKRPDPIRIAAGLPVGKDGAYFVGEEGYMGQSDGPDVIKYGDPDWKGGRYPCDQPGHWCQWTPVETQGCWSLPQWNDEEVDWTVFDGIGWDMGEKFYEYVEWLGYIITHFLEPWGYLLNGDVSWEGEEMGDAGVIEVVDNVITVHNGITSLEELKEFEETKSEKKAMVQALEHLATYLIDAEAIRQMKDGAMVIQGEG